MLSVIEDKKQGGIFFEQNNGTQIMAAFTNVLGSNRDSLLEAARDKKPWNIQWRFGDSAHVGSDLSVPKVEERFCGVTLDVKPEQSFEDSDAILYNHRYPRGVAIATPLKIDSECQDIMEGGGTVFYSFNKRTSPNVPVPAEHLDSYKHEGSLISVIVDKKQNGVFFEQHIGRGTKSCFTNALKGNEEKMLEAILGKKVLKLAWEHNTELSLSQQSVRTTPTYFR